MRSVSRAQTYSYMCMVDVHGRPRSTTIYAIENDGAQAATVRGAPRNAQAQPTRVCLRDADVASSPVIGRAYGSRSSNGSLRTAEITRDNRAGCGWYDFRVARETKVFHAFCATVGRKTF